MPLLDHFRPPYKETLPWSSVGTLWVATTVTWLNKLLPRDEYRAFANVRLGTEAEADIAEFKSETEPITPHRNGTPVALAEPPPAVATIDAIFPEELEVKIAEHRGSLVLSGVIEFVSPSNKKEPDERGAFVAKCVSYLRRGVGVVIVDVVTERLANFHNEIMGAIGGADGPTFPPGQGTYAAGYRPVHRRNRNVIEVWPYPVAVGQPIPSVPLGLRNGPIFPLDLETTYMTTLTNSGF